MDDQLTPTPPVTQPVTPQVSPEPIQQPTTVRIKHGHTFIYAYIIIVILVGSVAGVYAWQHNKVTSLEAQVASLQALQKTDNKLLVTLKKDSTPTSTKAVVTTGSVTSLLTTFYNHFTAQGSPNSTNTNAATPTRAQLVRQYGTSNLVSYYTPKQGLSYAEDPLVCAQDAPLSFTVSDVAITADGATATVTEMFNSPDVIKVALVNQSGSLKIDSITCNPPAVANAGPK